MAIVAWALLLFHAQLHSLLANSALASVNQTHHSPPTHCLPDQADALLKLKQSFYFNEYSTTTLPSWQAGTDCCLWEGVGCSSSFGHVTALNLGGFELNSQGIDPVLFNLTYLRVLDLSMNDFRDDIPSDGFERLTLLTHLNLSGSNIRGQVPAGIGKLTNLISLDLSVAFWDLSLYHFHNLVANLTNLRELILDEVLISSRAEDCFKALAKSTPHLRVLSLEDCGLVGHIDQSLSSLRYLVKINLGNNNGEIPTSLFTLLALQKLDLCWNQLSGTIPEFNATSSHLRSIFLSNNQLVGPIPQSFFVLTSLSYLDISWNNLTGLVDLTSFWRLWGLKLAYCNITRIPNFLTHLNDMAVLDLSSNKIRGNIPKWIWERWNSSLMSLNLSHNMFTAMELSSYVLPFKNHLYSFDISSNRLQGQIPMPSLSAKFFDYSNNIFSSVLPNFTQYLSRTNYLSLSKNNISSYLPNSICDSHIEVLDVSYNNFKGHIPQCLMGNGLLSILNLRGNHFEGAVPSNFSSGCSLQTMDLHGNKIEGQLPRALCNCTDLEVLDLGRNQIADYFPSWLGKLLNLRVLVLRSNQFHGSIRQLASTMV